MLFDKLRKSKQNKITYDPQEQKPVIRASICTGERVGGLKNLKTGGFTEIQLIESESDVEAFCRACGVESVETIY